MAIAQDRVAEKTSLAHAGIPVAAFVALADDADLDAAAALGDAGDRQDRQARL